MEAKQAMFQLREKVRDIPRDHLLRLITVKRIREALGTFKHNTAIGADATSFGELSLLPDEALEDLAEIIRDIITNLEWPEQAYLKLVALLGKRALGVSALLPRCTASQ